MCWLAVLMIGIMIGMIVMIGVIGISWRKGD